MNSYGLIGFPLGHSFSEQYFTKKFEEECLPGNIFRLFPIRHISDLPSLLQTETDLKGLAVTIPYKESVIPFIDSLQGDAQQIAAVNCIKISGKILTGYNTDVTGFEMSLIPLIDKSKIKALVLGNGGSSKAVQFALKRMGVDFLVVSRAVNSRAGFIEYNTIDEKMLSEYRLIINCTPVGMYPNINEYPQIPYQHIHDGNILYDLIYSPEQTLFLKKGQEKGATIKNGFEMLVLQAEENWRIWNE